MNFEKYKNLMNFPAMIEFTKYFAYHQGVAVFTGNPVQFEVFKNTALGKVAIVEKIKDDVAYMKARNEYCDETGRLMDLFKKDLFEEYGVTSNPKAEACYSIAYDLGHSNGLGEIELHFDRIVELIR